jgi:hypothetical protein
MSTNQIIAIAAVVVTSSTTLLVAYWHRKQIRQVEAFRQDPRAGLLPPPSSRWRFIVKNRVLIVGVGVNGLFLLISLCIDAPITRGTILAISASIGGIVLAAVLWALEWTWQTIARILDLMHRHLTVESSQPDAARPVEGKIIEKARTDGD